MAAVLADDIIKCIFMNTKLHNLIWISLKFVLKDLTDNKSALVQAMAWHQTGDKPLLEPMLDEFADIYAALGGDEFSQATASDLIKYP